MTVFDHFPRKEHMLFDRDEEGSAAPAGTSISGGAKSLCQLSAGCFGFMATIEGSETLKARACAIRGEIAQVIDGAGQHVVCLSHLVVHERM